MEDNHCKELKEKLKTEFKRKRFRLREFQDEVDRLTTALFQNEHHKQEGTMTFRQDIDRLVSIRRKLDNISSKLKGIHTEGSQEHVHLNAVHEELIALHSRRDVNTLNTSREFQKLIKLVIDLQSDNEWNCQLKEEIENKINKAYRRLAKQMAFLSWSEFKEDELNDLEQFIIQHVSPQKLQSCQHKSSDNISGSKETTCNSVDREHGEPSSLKGDNQVVSTSTVPQVLQGNAALQNTEMNADSPIPEVRVGPPLLEHNVGLPSPAVIVEPSFLESIAGLPSPEVRVRPPPLESIAGLPSPEDNAGFTSHKELIGSPSNIEKTWSSGPEFSTGSPSPDGIVGSQSLTCNASLATQSCNVRLQQNIASPIPRLNVGSLYTECKDGSLNQRCNPRFPVPLLNVESPVSDCTHYLNLDAIRFADSPINSPEKSPLKMSGPYKSTNLRYSPYKSPKNSSKGGNENCPFSRNTLNTSIRKSSQYTQNSAKRQPFQDCRNTIHKKRLVFTDRKVSYP